MENFVFFQKNNVSSIPPIIYCSGVLRSTSYNPTKIFVLRSTAVVCMCSQYVFAVQYVRAVQYVLVFVIAACMYQLYCGETLIGWFE